MKIHASHGLLLLCLLATPATATYYTLKEGRSLYEQGAYREALVVFSRLAEDGNAEAQYRLGRMILEGQHAAGDNRKACDWFEQAADNNHLAAFYELGNCYLNGRGRETDIDQAVYLYGVAAERGLVTAQYQLARMYASGSGVPKNPERAYIYLFLALRGDMTQAPLLKDSLEAELSDKAMQRAREFALGLMQRQSQSGKQPTLE